MGLKCPSECKDRWGWEFGALDVGVDRQRRARVTVTQECLHLCGCPAVHLEQAGGAGVAEIVRRDHAETERPADSATPPTSSHYDTPSRIWAGRLC